MQNMEDLELKEIRQFCGTSQYYNVMGVNVTDGVKYVMDNGYAWVVTDAVAVLKFADDLANQPFVSIKLTIEKDNEEVAVRITYTDGNGNTLYKQDYKWSNAEAEISFYYTQNVMMLTGEY